MNKVKLVSSLALAGIVLSAATPVLADTASAEANGLGVIGFADIDLPPSLPGTGPEYDIDTEPTPVPRGEVGIWAPFLNFGDSNNLGVANTRFDLVEETDLRFVNNTQNGVGDVTVSFTQPFHHNDDTSADRLDGTELFFNSTFASGSLAGLGTTPNLNVGSLPTFGAGGAMNTATFTIASDVAWGSFIFEFDGDDVELEVPFQNADTLETEGIYTAHLNWAFSVAP